ncbi:methylated-DNA--[protein]-cysteine S-methyltransferase [Litorivicinus lipolyticus]|uniref:Methylated-DNA--[protein]-cysteine S-methyltransferase n=1 Tax=Litorivicinus lipolyticus TaxID=418701 RepID=A0A5Q2Q940_9GAMM|nr:methylated-DNA--[protein]-cysteine S-methyltransferase [Litorivicinus lipolyticus]QGG79663.1 methylated-DNA--[protein]-cysteine S-methyltransferase [Litorivicinus lipolyticus]
MTSKSEQAWAVAGQVALATRDPSIDGHLWYGVMTTGVYCRISCPSPAPKPDNTRFFSSPSAALAAGFRACKRCHPDQLVPMPPYLERAMGALAKGVSPTQTAARLGIAPATLSRAFKRWLGFSPKQLELFAKTDRFKARMLDGQGVMRAALDAGFNDDKALYRSASTYVGMTPGAYGGDRLLTFGLAAVPLGWLLVAMHRHGLVFAGLGGTPGEVMLDLLRRFPNARLAPMDEAAGDALQTLSGQLAGGPWQSIPVELAATAFRLRVWHALRDIAPGQTLNYAELAARLDSPTAARAIGSACAANPICLSIPCHRVLPKSGGLGGYYWRPWRKAFLLALESRSTQ